MDLLKREMERKKKALEEAKKKKSDSNGSGGRYMKTIELRKHQEEQEQILNEQEKKKQQQQQLKRKLQQSNKDDDDDQIKNENQEMNDESQKHNETTNPTKRHKKRKNKERKHDQSSSSDTKDNSNNSLDKNVSTTTENNKEDTIKMPKEEVQKRLRLYGLPIHIFGENDNERIIRLEKAKEKQTKQKLDQSEANEYRLGQGHGIRNTFLEKDNNNKHSNSIELSKDKKDNKQLKEDNDNDEDIKNDPHKRVYKYLKGLIRQWEVDLNNRPDNIKQTLKGKNEIKTLKQCKDYIRPLFQQCKRRQLDDNMLTNLIKIIEYCEQGEFVKAHDSYLDVAIGRAAWPIGVTMVGIHARTGRAKIESSNVAHVMNSELQRKYLTSVKRLLTYAQSKRTDVDPSKKVMN